MNSRNRVLSALSHEIPDRIPLDGWFSKSVWEKIKKYLNIDDDKSVYKELGIDFRAVLMKAAPGFKQDQAFLEIIGKGLVVDDYIVRKIGKGIYEDEWGVRIQVNDSMDNWNYIYHPLSNCNSLENLIIPNLEISERFENLEKEINQLKDNYIVYTGISTLFRKGWLLCGFSKFLEMILLNPSYIEKLLDKLFDFTIKEIKLYVDLGVDMIEFLGDLGSEKAMLLSPFHWRSIFKPRLKEIINHFKKSNVIFFLHSDGNIREIMPDLIEIGIKILNPVQPECMDPVEIKKAFGDKLTMHGTLSLQKTFTFGNPKDVIYEAKDRIKTCSYNGGLILAPSNVFTKDVPIENIITFYDSLSKFKLD